MTDKKRSIQSIEIGGQLLNVLASESRAMTLKELAEKSNMTASKAHPYLVSFGRLGLIEQDILGQYQLGPAALQLGLSCLNQLDPLKIATPIVEKLALEIQQSVAIAVWGNLGPTIVRMIESRQPIHVNMRTGTVMSVSGTATGKIFAAFMPQEKITQLKLLGLGDRVSHGDLDSEKEQLTDQEIEQIRAQKIACAIGKPIPGVNALSVGVFDQSASLCLVITALGPAMTFPVDTNGHIAKSLTLAGNEISRRLGFFEALKNSNETNISLL